jgi:hypothetical protein
MPLDQHAGTCGAPGAPVCNATNEDAPRMQGGFKQTELVDARFRSDRTAERPQVSHPQGACPAIAANTLPITGQIRNSGAKSNAAIAAELNDRKIRTARGGRWTHVQVGSILSADRGPGVVRRTARGIQLGTTSGAALV